MKGEIEKKNHFNKRKRIRTKLVKIIYHKFGLEDEIGNKFKFYKKAKKKIKNEKNKD